MLRIVVVAMWVVLAAPVMAQSERNGLEGLRERVERGRSTDWLRSYDPPPARQIHGDYGRSVRQDIYESQQRYELNERIIRLENEAAARRFRGY